MDNNINTSFRQSLLELQEATKTGFVPWKRQNPTTYVYESTLSGTKYITSIQKLSPMEGGYAFQIINPETKEVILDLNSKITHSNRHVDANLVILVNELFEIVESSVNRRSADVLSNIVKNIKRK